MKTRIVFASLLAALLLAFIGVTSLIADQAPATKQTTSQGVSCDSTMSKGCCMHQGSKAGCGATCDMSKCACPSKGQCATGGKCACKSGECKCKGASCQSSACPRK